MKKLLLFLLTTSLFALTTNNTFRITFQNLKFQNEHMGLLETSYLFDFGNFYTGLSVYSAITGKRGGFFTGGVNLGYKYPLEKIILDSGLFIGGGGGGHAPQGSGLMLKIYAGALYPLNKNFNLVANLNHIKFKDGEIDSTQLALGVDYNFQDVYFLKPFNGYGYFSKERVFFSPFVLEYIPFDSKTTARTKQKRFSLIGAEIGKYKNENTFYFISTGGAFRGENDGYAEFLFGMGKKFPFLTLKASLGAGGGGEVDTKGGAIYKIEAQKNISFLNISAGYMGSFGGVKAYYLKAAINKNFNFASVGENYLKIETKKFRISLYSESYLPSNTIRKDDDSKRLDVMNVDLGYFIDENYYAFINAASAYNGGSGGYAVGMFGVGYEKNFFAKIAVGAAGGGRVDVGGGLLAKAVIGYKYKNFSIGIGRIKAFEGRLDTTILDIGIDFDFYKGIVE